MNPVVLKLRNGATLEYSPIGLRFADDPDNGPLVLCPKAGGGVEAQALGMTIEEAREAFALATADVAGLAARMGRLEAIVHGQPHSNETAVKLEEIEKKLELYSRTLVQLEERSISSVDFWAVHDDRLYALEAKAQALGGRLTGTEARLGKLFDDYCRHEDSSDDRWGALAIHLGLPEGWETHHELAAETKGALVSQAEMLDALARRLQDETQWRISFLREIGLEIAEVDGRAIPVLRDTVVKASFSGLAGTVDELKNRLSSLQDSGNHNCNKWSEIENRLENLQRELSLLKEESSLFTLAERVGSLEHTRTLQRKRLTSAERRLRWLEENVHDSVAADDSRIDSLSRHLGEVELWIMKQDRNWLKTVHDQQDFSSASPRLDDRNCAQKTVTVPPVTIAWSKDGPVDAFTGEPITVESWTGPEPEKPKSAWKPLTEAAKDERCPVVIRPRGNPSARSYELAWWWYGRGWVSQNGTRSHGEKNTEFCPIPE